MSLLALDIATKTGWAVHCDDGVLLSGSKSFAPKRGDGEGKRYRNFREWLLPLLARERVTRVIYERPIMHHVGGYAAEVIHGLTTQMKVALDEAGITDYESVAPTTLKKFATGSGKAKKVQMLSAAHHRWPDQDVKDDNQADALWALAYAEENK